MLAVKIFLWGTGAGEQQKLNARIFVHNKHFVHLIFVGCHNP